MFCLLLLLLLLLKALLVAWPRVIVGVIDSSLSEFPAEVILSLVCRVKDALTGPSKDLSDSASVESGPVAFGGQRVLRVASGMVSK